MEEHQIKQLKDLLYELKSASTKKEAKPILDRLNFMALSLHSQLDPYHRGKLREVIGYASEASGQVRNKAHWVNALDQSWYIFEGGIQKNTEN